MSEHYDTYFINPKLALKAARRQNKVKLYNGLGTQLCYYSGKKIKNVPKNMIQMPIENIKEFFNHNSYRLPEYIDFNKSTYTDDELQVNYKNILLSLFKEIRNEEMKKNEHLLEKIKSQDSPLFNKECINFVIIVSRTLGYDYEYAKQLKKSLKNLGHSITILTEPGSKKLLINHLKTNFILEKLHTIKPNVIIFINDYKPKIVPDDTFQISIINGFIPLLKSIKKDDIRQKDILISQNQYINKLLTSKKILVNKINPIIQFEKHESKSKTKKYKLSIFASYFNLNDYILFQEMVRIFSKKINTETISLQKILEYMNEMDYENKRDYEMILYIQKNIILQNCIQWLDSNSKNVTIFGGNWDKFKKLPPHAKVKNTNKAIKKYQKSEYIIQISSNIIDVNLLEVLNAGATPVVYDLRQEDESYDTKFDDYCLFFKNKEELNNILKKSIQPKRQYTKEIFQNYTFNNLSKEILSFITINNEY